MSDAIHQQLHGYRTGHQLLKSSIRLARSDQETINRLSDMAGPLRPGEHFAPYLSSYPLPSSSFYVFARTEEDLDAPRAGCVLTRSLLIPMDYWESAGIPAEFAKVLYDSSYTIETPISIPLLPKGSPLPPISTPELSELVEALFLVKRIPIVIFDTEYATPVALRLLTALWPGMRRNFSLSTYALSPRMLSGRAFDLLFAPKTARSRFSGWDGRRIEGTGRPPGARHRWTSIIVQRVFQSSIPHLLEPDSSGVLPRNAEGTESELRVTLLWEELQARAAESPTAVLGLVDIATSRNALDSTWSTLGPAIAVATESASISMPPQQAWAFIAALTAKIDGDHITGAVGQALASASNRLTTKDWRSALHFALSDELPAGTARDIVLPAVADHMADAPADQFELELLGIPPARMLELVAASDFVASSVLPDSSRPVHDMLLGRLSEALELASPQSLALLRTRCLPRIRGDVHTRVLAQLLRGATPADLTLAIKTIWSNGDRRSAGVGLTLCQAAMTARAKAEARSAFASRSNHDELTIDCIQRLIEADPQDIRWILRTPSVRQRAPVLLDRVITRMTTQELIQAFRSVAVVEQTLQVLATDLQMYAMSAARLILLPTFVAADYSEQALQIFTALPHADRPRFASMLVDRVLTDEKLELAGLAEKILVSVADCVDAREIILAGGRESQTGARLSRALIVFDSSTPKLRERLLTHLELLVRQVVRRPAFDISSDGARALANLIDGAARSNSVAHLRVCSLILPFAMAARQQPASPLIVAAFPHVYEELRKDVDAFDIIRIFLFVDWDKCKVARRDLVRAFMASAWPPADLAITAYLSGDLGRFIKRLLKEDGGDRYLSRIAVDSERLNETFRRPIMSTIREVTNSGPTVFEWET